MNTNATMPEEQEVPHALEEIDVLVEPMQVVETQAQRLAQLQTRYDALGAYILACNVLPRRLLAIEQQDLIGTLILIQMMFMREGVMPRDLEM